MPRRAKRVAGPARAALTKKRRAPRTTTVANAANVAAQQRPLGSVDIDSLSGQSLKDYAARAGVSKRDIEHLTEDRLRQNTKLFIQNHFDLIDEGY